MPSTSLSTAGAEALASFWLAEPEAAPELAEPLELLPQAVSPRAMVRARPIARTFFFIISNLLFFIGRRPPPFLQADMSILLKNMQRQ